MIKNTTLAVLVALQGLLLTYVLCTELFDLEPGQDFPIFAVVGLALAGIPTVLSLLQARTALLLLFVCAMSVGLWAYSGMQMAGDGAIGGYLLMGLVIIFLAVGLTVIGIRYLLIKDPSD